MAGIGCADRGVLPSDGGLADAIYESRAMREFMGIELAREQIPDATTLLKFRRLLEDNQLTLAIFERINVHLGESGLLMREGTLVDTEFGPAHSTHATAANESDVAHTQEMLHGQEERVHDDAGYAAWTSDGRSSKHRRLATFARMWNSSRPPSAA